ncbi:hypothetical protein AAFF_G00060070 [Aldrovandia affinis]|uniref:Uncharacterized protein n=1 Tax=Aldrovandia affinis TaxID=143900 RepID=A0AAD7S040_9TELE|nr:hypothetical protein AAFF_G00060070 [Aldrovandia affinis]
MMAASTYSLRAAPPGVVQWLRTTTRWRKGKPHRSASTQLSGRTPLKHTRSLFSRATTRDVAVLKMFRFAVGCVFVQRQRQCPGPGPAWAEWAQCVCQALLTGGVEHAL